MNFITFVYMSVGRQFSNALLLFIKFEIFKKT
jgi:hypothetical protein